MELKPQYIVFSRLRSGYILRIIAFATDLKSLAVTGVSVQVRSQAP